MIDIPMETYCKYFKLPMCISLLIFGFLPFIQNGKWQNRILQYLGNYSLEIYLWHVLPLILLKHFFGNNTKVYYTVSFITIVLFVLLTYFVSIKKNNDEKNSIYTCKRRQ